MMVVMVVIKVTSIDKVQLSSRSLQAQSITIITDSAESLFDGMSQNRCLSYLESNSESQATAANGLIISTLTAETVKIHL